MNPASSSTPAESSLVFCIDDGEIALRVRQMDRCCLPVRVTCC